MLQNFLRELSKEDRAAYNAEKGPGSNARKKAMRDTWHAASLKNGTAKMEDVKQEEHADNKIGTYLNIYAIAQKEGGLIDKETGMRCATNWAAHCEKKGGICSVYDPAAKSVKYLHFETGVSEKISNARRQILQADVDMAPELVQQAMKQMAADGLVPVSEAPSATDSTSAPSVTIVSGNAKPVTVVKSELDEPSTSPVTTTGPQLSTKPAVSPPVDLAAMMKLVGIVPGEVATPAQSSMLQTLLSMHVSPPASDQDKQLPEKPEKPEKPENV